MLDNFCNRLVRVPVTRTASCLNHWGISANQVTLWGFAIGCLAFPAIILQQYWLALLCILINRIFDGLDGALARIQGITDAGGFLDISLDFIFYSLIPFAFVLANPEQNAVAGALLIFSFIGSGSSFLSFAVMAGKQGIESPVYQHKSLYYMTGLTEGTETIACLVAFCIFPQHFALIAYIFAAACWITTFTRIYSGFQTLNKISANTCPIVTGPLTTERQRVEDAGYPQAGHGCSEAG